MTTAEVLVLMTFAAAFAVVAVALFGGWSLRDEPLAHVVREPRRDGGGRGGDVVLVPVPAGLYWTASEIVGGDADAVARLVARSLTDAVEQMAADPRRSTPAPPPGETRPPPPPGPSP